MATLEPAAGRDKDRSLTHYDHHYQLTSQPKPTGQIVEVYLQAGNTYAHGLVSSDLNVGREVGYLPPTRARSVN